MAILTSDYNELQARISKILGVGENEFGYGQTVSSFYLANTVPALIADFTRLRNDILAARYHQIGVPATLPISVISTQITAANWTQFLSVMTQVETSKLVSPNVTQATRIELVNEVTPETTWNNTTTHTLTVQFDDADHMRYYFNTGSAIEFSASHVNTATNSKSVAWNSLLSGVGVVSFKQLATTSSKTSGSVIGFNALTTEDQIIFKKTKVDTPAANVYQIAARQEVYEETGEPTGVLIFTIKYINTGANVTGQIYSIVKVYHASGSYVAIDPPAITSEFDAGVSNPTFALSRTVNTVNETSINVEFTVTTTNFLDGLLYFRISGTSISIGDFSPDSDLVLGTLRGTVEILNNSGTFTLIPAADLFTEGKEQFQVELRIDENLKSPVLAQLSSLEIITDTSLTPPIPTYKIMPLSTTSVSEGQTILYRIFTTNVKNGSDLYWSTKVLTPSLLSSDFLDNRLNGVLTVYGNYTELYRTIYEDTITETTSESYQIVLSEVDVTTAISKTVQTSEVVKITDKISIEPIIPYVVLVDDNSIPEDSTTKITFTINTPKLPTNTKLYWKTVKDSGVLEAADFTDNTLTGTVVINSSNVGIVTRKAKKDALTEGNETFHLSVFSDVGMTKWLVDSDPVTIEETISYALIRTPATMAESTTSGALGAGVTFNLTTPWLPNGTVLYWTTVSDQGVVEAADFTDNAIDGFVTITENYKGVILRRAAKDSFVEGTEQFHLEIRATVGTIGPILVSSQLTSITETVAYEIIPLTSYMVEDQPGIEFNVKTPFLKEGTLLYWDTIPVTGAVTASDFTDNRLSGTVEINGNVGSFTRTAILDSLTEGKESFQIILKTGSSISTKVATSSIVTIGETVAYTIGLTNPTFTEGLAPITVSITTPDVLDNTKIYWTILKHAGNITADDFIVSDAQGGIGQRLDGFVLTKKNRASFIISARRDLVTEEPETFNIELRTDSILGGVQATSALITLNEIIPYTIVPAGLTVVNEGDTVQFNVTTPWISDQEKRQLNWTTYSTLGTINTSDHPDFTDSISGSVIVKGSSAQIFRTINKDTFTELGVKNFGLKLWDTLGNLLATSTVVTMNDTSQTIVVPEPEPPTYSVVPRKSKIIEGESVIFDIITDNVLPATPLYWSTIRSNNCELLQTQSSSPINIAYDNPGTASKAGHATITVTASANNNRVEADRMFLLVLRTGSVNGTEVATSVMPVALVDATPYLIRANNSSITEGSQTGVRFDISTPDAAFGTIMTYTIVSEAGSDITFDDFVGLSSLTNPVTIDQYGAGNFTLRAAANAPKEFDESFRIELRLQGSQTPVTLGAPSPVVRITETAVYSLVSTTENNSVMEGSAATFTFSTPKLLTNIMYSYRIVGVGANGGSISGSDFSPAGLTGNFTVTSELSSYSLSILTTAGSSNPEGSEQFQLEITSGGSPVVLSGGSPIITITENTPYTITPLVSSPVQEGDNISFRITSPLLPLNTQLLCMIKPTNTSGEGSFTAQDIDKNTFSQYASLTDGYSGKIEFVAKDDGTVKGSRPFTVWLYDKDNENYVISSTVVITDRPQLTPVDPPSPPTPHPATFGGINTGSVKEDTILTAVGALTVSDVDAGESAFQTPSNLNGTYGVFTFDVTNGRWTYTLDNSRASVQALTAAGAAAIDTLVVKSVDGTPHDIKVTINGTDDIGPPPDPVPEPLASSWRLETQHQSYMFGDPILLKLISSTTSNSDRTLGWNIEFSAGIPFAAILPPPNGWTTSISGTVTIPPGQANQSFSIPTTYLISGMVGINIRVTLKSNGSEITYKNNNTAVTWATKLTVLLYYIQAVEIYLDTSTVLIHNPQHEQSTPITYKVSVPSYYPYETIEIYAEPNSYFVESLAPFYVESPITVIKPAPRQTSWELSRGIIKDVPNIVSPQTLGQPITLNFKVPYDWSNLRVSPVVSKPSFTVVAPDAITITANKQEINETTDNTVVFTVVSPNSYPTNTYIQYSIVANFDVSDLMVAGVPLDSFSGKTGYKMQAANRQTTFSFTAVDRPGEKPNRSFYLSIEKVDSTGGGGIYLKDSPRVAIKSTVVTHTMVINSIQNGNGASSTTITMPTSLTSAYDKTTEYLKITATVHPSMPFTMINCKLRTNIPALNGALTIDNYTFAESPNEMRTRTTDNNSVVTFEIKSKYRSDIPNSTDFAISLSSDAEPTCNISSSELTFKVITPTLARSITFTDGTFTETAANDGVVTGQLIMTLANDTFLGSINTVLTGVTFTNVPAGLIARITKISENVAHLTFTGNATNHGSANNVTNVGMTLLDTAFKGGLATTVNGYRILDIAITFKDPLARSIRYSADTVYESTANDGSIADAITMTLDNDTFTGSINGVVTGASVSGGIPAGLTARITKTSDKVATLTFTGKATNHGTANNVTNLVITFANNSFTGGSASAVTGYTKSSIAITFNNPLARSIRYTNITFTESTANDGSIADAMTMTLDNDTFTGSINGVVTGAFVSGGIPNGLTAVVTKTSNNGATLTFTGNAIGHGSANNANLVITFANSSFTGGLATAVTDYTKSGIAIMFKDPPPIRSITFSKITFTESTANDGSITGYMTMMLANDMFTGSINGVVTGVTFTNVPAGLTAVVTKTSNTLAHLTFTGNATNHGSANNVTNVGMTLLDTAFTNGSATTVTGSTKSNIAITFKDQTVFTTNMILVDSIVDANKSSVLTITGGKPYDKGVVKAVGAQWLAGLDFTSGLTIALSPEGSYTAQVGTWKTGGATTFTATFAVSKLCSATLTVNNPPKPPVTGEIIYFDNTYYAGVSTKDYGTATCKFLNATTQGTITISIHSTDANAHLIRQAFNADSITGILPKSYITSSTYPYVVSVQLTARQITGLPLSSTFTVRFTSDYINGNAQVFVETGLITLKGQEVYTNALTLEPAPLGSHYVSLKINVTGKPGTNVVISCEGIVVVKTNVSVGNIKLDPLGKGSMQYNVANNSHPNSASPFYTMSLGAKGKIKATFFDNASLSQEFVITGKYGVSSGSQTSVTVPQGTVVTAAAVGAGGGGGASIEVGSWNGTSGGGGGAGGTSRVQFISNGLPITLVSGKGGMGGIDTITTEIAKKLCVTIPPTDGGNSTITYNGGTTLTAFGGKAGGRGIAWMTTEQPVPAGGAGGNGTSNYGEQGESGVVDKNLNPPSGASTNRGSKGGVNVYTEGYGSGGSSPTISESGDQTSWAKKPGMSGVNGLAIISWIDLTVPAVTSSDPVAAAPATTPSGSSLTPELPPSFTTVTYNAYTPTANGLAKYWAYTSLVGNTHDPRMYWENLNIPVVSGMTITSLGYDQLGTFTLYNSTGSTFQVPGQVATPTWPIPPNFGTIVKIEIYRTSWAFATGYISNLGGAVLWSTTSPADHFSTTVTITPVQPVINYVNYVQHTPTGSGINKYWVYPKIPWNVEPYGRSYWENLNITITTGMVMKGVGVENTLTSFVLTNSTGATTTINANNQDQPLNVSFGTIVSIQVIQKWGFVAGTITAGGVLHWSTLDIAQHKG